MDTQRYAVILAGGRGERFWPLSTARRPKQLLNLVGDDTLLGSVWRTVRAQGSLLKGLKAGPTSRSNCTRTLKTNATLPKPGKLPNASQYLTPW